MLTSFWHKSDSDTSKCMLKPKQNFNTTFNLQLPSEYSKCKWGQAMRNKFNINHTQRISVYSKNMANIKENCNFTKIYSPQKARSKQVMLPPKLIKFNDQRQNKAKIEKIKQKLCFNTISFQKKKENQLNINNQIVSSVWATDIDSICSMTSSIIIDETDNFQFDKNFKLLPSIKVNLISKKDFQILKYLGKGKFGQVHLVLHIKTGFVCAMKKISKVLIKQEKMQGQLARQLRIHNSLKHLNIISFYSFFEEYENIFILLQYGTGGEVFSKLKDRNRLEEIETISIIKHVVEGLNMIHNMGYIHRDIKPENLIMQYGVVKICDLGWAVDCSNLETRKSYCGTPLYFSPEMVRKQRYNSASDIWSIGLLAYELMVGKIPFSIWSENDLHQILHQDIIFPNYIDISETLKDLINRCLCKQQYLRISVKNIQQHPIFKTLKMETYFNYQLYQQCNQIF